MDTRSLVAQKCASALLSIETQKALVELIDGCCRALDACVERANELVESAWVVLDPLLQFSTVKVMLRAFDWYAVRRHD